MGEVEGDQGRLGGEDGVPEQGGGSLGVDEYVELGPGGEVADALLAVDLAEHGGGEAAAEGAAHDAEPADVCREVRVLQEQGTDVGETARGHDVRGTGLRCPQRRSHGVDGGHGAVGGRLWARQQVRPVQAGLAVDVGRRVDGRALEGVGGTRVDRQLMLLADGGEYRQGVVGGLVQASVPVHGADVQ